MKAFNDYDKAKEAARQTGSGTKLPPGAYKAKIIGVKYEAGKNGTSDRILIQFDITEGEFKDFFRTQYDENTSEDKKWKGKAAIYVPVDDGSERGLMPWRTPMSVIHGTGMKRSGKTSLSVSCMPRHGRQSTEDLSSTQRSVIPWQSEK